MALNCKLHPDNSKLHPELVQYFKDNGFSAEEARHTATDVWEKAVGIPFQKKFDITEFYDNPTNSLKEPLLETVVEHMDLENVIAEQNEIKKANLEAGNKTKSMKVYDTYKDATDQANIINEKRPQLNATVIENKGGYSIEISNRTLQNAEQPKTLKFNSTLSNKLLNIVRSAGFEVSVEDVVRKDGYFDPENAEITANNLIKLIRIAKGTMGENQFPEEFSHMVIAGTKHTPFTKRLIDSIKSVDGAVEEILGDEYDEYESLYRQKAKDADELYNMMVDEAAGHLLKQKLIEKNEQPTFKFTLDNAWKYAKRRLFKIKESDVEKAITDANEAAYQMSRIADTEKIIPFIDDVEVLKSYSLHHIQNELTKEMKISNKILALTEKKMQLEKMQSPNKKYTEASMKNLQSLRKEYKTNDNYNIYLNFMVNTLSDFNNIIASLNDEYELRKKMNVDSRNDLKKLADTAKLIRQFKEFKDAYEPVLEELAIMDELQRRGEIDLNEKQAETVSTEAEKILKRVSKTTKSVIDDLQFNVILDFLRTYAGDELLQKAAVADDKESKDLIESLLKRASDINFIENTVKSLANCSDVILQLIDKAVKVQHAKRDNDLTNVKNAFTALVSDFVKKGYNPRFMLEKNKDGKLTGRIISDIDFEKFEKAKQAEIERIEREYADKSKFFKREQIEKWIANHTEEEVILSKDLYGNTTDNLSNRTERVPRKDLYGKPEGQRLKDTLTAEQYTFYNKVMYLKRGLDAMMPASQVSLYLAPQKANKMLEAVAKKDKKGKAFIGAVKDGFIRRTDLGERGFQPMEDELDGVFNDAESQEAYDKFVNTDLAGNPIKRIPIYMNRPLEDMDRLSEDFAGSFLAYAGMVHNYVGMSEIVDLLEITRDYVKNKREYTKKGINLKDRFKVMGNTTTVTSTIKGTDAKTGERIDKYYDMQVYGEMKAEELAKIGDNVIDTAKWLDMLKSYTGALGLGLNVFAGISNDIMGKIQMTIESAGGEYMNMKDFAKAGLEYRKEIWKYLAEFNQIQKKSKMALLVDKFDMLDEFFNNLKYDDYYASDLARIIGKQNLYILNNLGEHELHTKGGIAMLMHQKVRVKEGNSWKETNLYNAYKVKESTDENGVKSYDLVLDDSTEIAVTDKEGNTTYRKITEKDITDMRLRIGAINRRMHGAFNDEDRGAIQNKAIGRLIMQFRQWMPEYYENRWGSKKENVILDKQTEGFYLTFGRFMLDTIRDLKRGNFELKTRYKNLQSWEKANLRKFTAEMAILIGILALIRGLGDLKDKKGYWDKRMLAYQLRRMKLEITAGFDPSNAISILQSPMASIRTFDGLLNLFKFWNLNDEIQSGRYKGWSKYHRDVYKAFPVYQQLRRVADVKDEDYMFTIFKLEKGGTF